MMREKNSKMKKKNENVPSRTPRNHHHIFSPRFSLRERIIIPSQKGGRRERERRRKWGRLLLPRANRMQFFRTRLDSFGFTRQVLRTSRRRMMMTKKKAKKKKNIIIRCDSSTVRNTKDGRCAPTTRSTSLGGFIKRPRW